MATAIGTNVVTAIARRFILPEIVDNIYRSNVVFFRLNSMNKRIVRGGTHIEVPLMYSEFVNGGWYTGYDTLNNAPNDTVKNGAWDWRQAHVPVTVDGLTLIKTDSPEAIANFIQLYFAQAEMQMSEILGDGVFSAGVAGPSMDGLGAAVDDGGVAAVYGGITRASNTWWNAQDDSTTSTLTYTALNSMHGSCSEGGKHPTLMVSRREQYNRYWALGVAKQTFVNNMPGQYDQQLHSAGFDNQLFNGVPWVVDSHVFNGPNASNSAIVMLCEDFIELAVSPRADFYLEDFQTPTDQDAMTAKLLWAGNLVLTNCARQGKLSNISA